MSSTDPQLRPRPPGPSLKVSLALIIVGLLLAIPTAVAGLVPIFRALGSGTSFEAPATVQVHLGKGTYMIYQDVGDVSIGNAFANNDTTTLTPSDVTVTAPDSSDIAPFDPGSVVETRTNGGHRYVGAARFTTPAAGTYTVQVRVDDATSTGVLVARPISDTISSAIGWLALAGIGGIILVVGVVLLIVGSVRRGRIANAFAYNPATPAGWHPDPSGSGRLRYWDGYRWTEHLH